MVVALWASESKVATTHLILLSGWAGISGCHLVLTSVFRFFRRRILRSRKMAPTWHNPLEKNFHVHRRLPPSITTQLSRKEPIILEIRRIGHALPIPGRLRRPLRASGRPVKSRTYFNVRWRTRRQNRSRRGLCRSRISGSSEFAAESTRRWQCFVYVQSL